MIVAKTNDNAEQGGAGEPGPAGLSGSIMAALGEYAEGLGLAQADDESEIDFAVRSIEVLRAFTSERAAELTSIKRRLASQKGAATKFKSKIVELEEAGKPRRLGAMEAGDFTAIDLMTAIDSAEEIVLAFSDGTVEVKGIKPRKVDPAAFRLRHNQVLFTDDTLEVRGPSDDETVSTMLAGVALLLDGEQVAWSPMAQPISIGAGQTFNLAGSVIFG